MYKVPSCEMIEMTTGHALVSIGVTCTVYIYRSMHCRSISRTPYSYCNCLVPASARHKFSASPGLDERDAAFMQRLRNFAHEALTWPHLGEPQRLVWAAAMELEAVPFQELLGDSHLCPVCTLYMRSFRE